MTVTDPRLLHGIVQSLGGSVIEARTFQFDLPLGEVRSVVPKITAMAGVGARRVEGHDRVADTASGPQTFVRIELYDKTQAPKETGSILDIMPW